jgi:gas vesicle protein
MKLSDISDLSQDDILSALGLASKPTNSERLLSALSIFGVGLLVGAGAALLLAPKSGQGLREDLSERFRKARNGATDASVPSEASHVQDEART